MAKYAIIGLTLGLFITWLACGKVVRYKSDGTKE